MRFKSTLLTIFSAIAIVALLAVGLNLATRPEKTPQQIMAESPRFTFRVSCNVRSLAPMIQSWKLGVNDKGVADGRPKLDEETGEDETPRKYSLTCNIKDAKVDVLPLDTTVENSIPIMKSGDHSFTLLQDSAMTMLNLEAGKYHIKYPLDSQGLLIYEIPLFNWVDDYPVNLFCWEDIGSSGNPEHVCQLF